MRIGLFGGLDGGFGIGFGTIQEQVQHHCTERGQQDAGLDQRMQAVRHPLLEVRCDQGNHADADGDRHDQAVVSVGFEVDTGQDADAGGCHHAEHHEARAAEQREAQPREGFREGDGGDRSRGARDGGGEQGERGAGENADLTQVGARFSAAGTSRPRRSGLQCTDDGLAPCR